MSRPMSVRPSVEMVSCSACTPPATTIVVFGLAASMAIWIDSPGSTTTVRPCAATGCASATPSVATLSPATAARTGGMRLDRWRWVRGMVCSRSSWAVVATSPGSAAWGRRCPESRSVPSEWVTAITVGASGCVSVASRLRPAHPGRPPGTYCRTGGRRGAGAAGDRGRPAGVGLAEGARHRRAAGAAGPARGVRRRARRRRLGRAPASVGDEDVAEPGVARPQRRAGAGDRPGR